MTRLLLCLFSSILISSNGFSNGALYTGVNNKQTLERSVYKPIRITDDIGIPSNARFYVHDANAFPGQERSGYLLNYKETDSYSSSPWYVLNKLSQALEHYTSEDYQNQSSHVLRDICKHTTKQRLKLYIADNPVSVGFLSLNYSDNTSVCYNYSITNFEDNLSSPAPEAVTLKDMMCYQLYHFCIDNEAITRSAL